MLFRVLVLSAAMCHAYMPAARNTPHGRAARAIDADATRDASPNVAMTTVMPRRMSTAIDPICENTYHDAAINSGEYVVIKIHAGYCRACHRMEPKFKRVARDWTKKSVVFKSLRFEENEAFCRALGITKLPTVQVFKGGQHVDNIVEGSNIQGLVSSLRHHVDGEEFGI